MLKIGDKVKLKSGVVTIGPKPRIGEKNHSWAYVAGEPTRIGTIMLDRPLKGFRFRVIDELELSL